MSPQQTKRSARHSTTWLLAFLCLSLLSWRLLTRIDQYHPLVSGRPAQVSFFDANESSIGSVSVARSTWRPMAKVRGRLFTIAPPQPPARPILSGHVDTRTALPHLCSHLVPLFSNPPPVSRA